MKKTKAAILDLQRFAENVQTTKTTGVGNELSPEMKTYYDRTLLDEAQPNLVHDQFGQERDIPRGGGKTIEFRKFSSLPKATTPLTEGVTPDGGKLNVTAITATIQQYGYYVAVSDLLDMTAIDPVISETVRQLGSQAGITLDTITREELQGGTNVYYVPDRSSGEEVEVKSRATLGGGSTAHLKDIFVCAAILKGKNAPKIDGSYVAIVHPYVAMELMAEAGAGWLDVMKYGDPKRIFEGELGKVGGVRFVESSEAKIYADAGAEGADGESGKYSVYGTLVLGNNAYGKTAIAGAGLETIVKPRGSAGTADPLNQRSTVGWKATKVAKRLCEEYMVRMESTVGSSFFNQAAAN